MDTLARLVETIAARRKADPESSYVAQLFAKGVPEIARKVGEEAVETAIAATAYDKDTVRAEAADLLFHLLILLEARDLSLADVLEELDRRDGVSGIAEKNSRSQP